MLTIIHIIENLSDYGGTPRKLLYLTQALNKEECQQVYFCYLPSDLTSQFERFGAVVECIHGSSLFNIIRRAIFLVRKHKPNVIYTHFSRPLIVGYVVALVTGLPVVHNEHSSAHYRRGVGRLLAHFILPRVQAITCNSAYTLQSISEVFALPAEKMTVLHNPVVCRESMSSRAEQRKAFGISEKCLVIGHIGGMIPQRDQATLIRSFARVRCKQENVQLVIIGDGPRRAELEALARDLRLNDCVVFTGYTDKIGDYLQIIDIYVNPTLDEGFGIAVVEAMHAGLPVILSNNGAHPELIHDGKSGFLYPGGDVDALTKAIELLMTNPELRELLGSAAKARAVSHFSPERYANAFLTHALNTVETFNVSTSTLRRK